VKKISTVAVAEGMIKKESDQARWVNLGNEDEGVITCDNYMDLTTEENTVIKKEIQLKSEEKMQDNHFHSDTVVGDPDYVVESYLSEIGSVTVNWKISDLRACRQLREIVKSPTFTIAATHDPLTISK
jgi:hypothetical protein